MSGRMSLYGLSLSQSTGLFSYPYRYEINDNVYFILAQLENTIGCHIRGIKNKRPHRVLPFYTAWSQSHRG